MNTPATSASRSSQITARTALVTGANRGLGKETALQLAKLGYRVLLGMRRPEQSVEWIDGCKREGLDVTAIALDVSSDTSAATAVAELTSRFPPIDVLVNNAGVFQDIEASGAYGDFFNTALNAVTRMVAEDCRLATGTDGQSQGGEIIVWAATLPRGGITGAFLRDKEQIAW